MNSGPFQIHLKEYPAKGPTKHPRKFQYSWFSIFPNWLKYSPTTHCAYCFLCLLVEKCYSEDFTEQERVRLKYELELLGIAMKDNVELSQVSTLADLCISLAKTEKRVSYPITDILIRLILTLPVSTATTEIAFSAMKICKTRLRNKMADEFLADNLVVYIEKEIIETFSSDNVIDVFKNLKGRNADL